jgi:hypothetical protein
MIPAHRLGESDFEAGPSWGAPAAPPPPPPKARIRTVERFKGPRLKNRTGPWRRIRSAFGLLVITVILGAALGAVLSAIVWGISVGIHHASGS